MLYFIIHMIIYALFGLAFWNGLADSPSDIAYQDYHGEQKMRKERIKVLAILGGFMLTSSIIMALIAA